MPASPLAGKPAPPDLLIDADRLVAAYYDLPPRSREPAARGGVRDQRPPRRARGRRLQRGAHPGDHAGDLRAPRARRDHRAAVSRRRHARGVGAGAEDARWRCWRRRASRRWSRAEGDYTPTPALSRAILSYNDGRKDGLGRRHHHHAVAQPAARRRLQVQPAERRPGRQRHHRRDPGARQRAAARARRGQARAVRGRRARRRRRASIDFLTPYVEDLPGVDRRRGDRARQASRSAPIRWGAPACSTGRASASASGWT